MKNVLAGRNERSLYKLVVDGETDQVVGVHMIGPDAPEILQAAAIAVKARLKKADFDATVALHPTMAEELVLMRSDQGLRGCDRPASVAADQLKLGGAVARDLELHPLHRIARRRRTRWRRPRPVANFGPPSRWKTSLPSSLRDVAHADRRRHIAAAEARSRPASSCASSTWALPSSTSLSRPVALTASLRSACICATSSALSWLGLDGGRDADLFPVLAGRCEDRAADRDADHEAAGDREEFVADSRRRRSFSPISSPSLKPPTWPMNSSAALALRPPVST